MPDYFSYFTFTSDFEAASSRREHCATLLGGGDGRGKERWRLREIAVNGLRGAPLGLLRAQQLGACGEKKHPGASPQRPREDLQALVEPLQEGRDEKLLRGPVGQDRLLQRVRVLR